MQHLSSRLFRVFFLLAALSTLPVFQACGQQTYVGRFDVYGGYAVKLLRLQSELIQTFDRHQRGNKQTVEVRHVHIHSRGQGVKSGSSIHRPDQTGGDQE